MNKSEIPHTENIPDNNEVVVNEELMLNEFRDLFQPGRTFATRANLQSEVARYGQKYNVVMSTKNSNYRSVHLWCKHAGIYKQGKRVRKSATPDKVVKPRNKVTKRTGCGCYIKARLVKDVWIIEHSFGAHNHIIPNSRTVYSFHRKQSEEIKSLILQLLNDGQKVSNILEYLHMIGISNIIKKDIENLQQQYKRKEKEKLLSNEMATATSAVIGTSNMSVATPTLTTTTSTEMQSCFDQLTYPPSSIPVNHYTSTALNTIKQ